MRCYSNLKISQYVQPVSVSHILYSVNRRLMKNCKDQKKELH